MVNDYSRKLKHNSLNNYEKKFQNKICIMKYGKNKHSIIGDFILFFNFYVNKLLTNFPRFYTCLFACPCNISVDIEPGFIKKDALFFPCLIKKGHMGACADRTRLFMVLACDTSLLTIVLSQIKLVFIAFFFFLFDTKSLKCD